MFKAIRLSCCVEVYQTWSKQSLMEAAIQCLKICSSENESQHSGWCRNTVFPSCFPSRIYVKLHSNNFFLFSFCKVPRESSDDQVTVTLAGIHQSACHYASAFLKAQSFSPQTYVAFISFFGYICSKLQGEWQNKNNR